MAWKFVKLRQLAFRFSNGHEDVTITNVNPTDSNMTMNGVIAANPYQFSDRLIARYNIEGAAAVDALYAFGVGSIDIFGGLYDLLVGTEYMDLYNPIAGHDAGFIRFTRGNNNYYSYTAYAWFNGQSAQMYGPSSTAWQSTYVRSQDLPRRPQCGISFLVDDFGMVIYCATMSEPTWSNKNLDQKNVYFNYAGRMNNMIIQNVCRVLLNLNIVPDITPSTDPYADGGTSTGTTTGTGTFDDTSESVSLPTTYAMSATASGLMSQYVMSEANLSAFANWLWNGGSIVDDLKHFFASPMEAIFSLGMLPFTPSDTTNYHVYVGALDAGVTGGLVGDTVEKIDCGTIDFAGYYGSALDFNPYTKIEIFLPYCGNFALNPDEVMGHTIGVKYYCDTVTGDCVAFIYDEERVLYQVKGNCFVQIPLAARDFTAQYASAIGTVGTVAAGLAASVASGGLTAPVAVGMGTSVAANAMNAKAHVARAGGVSGMAGFMSIQTPYVIITVPNQCLPELQADHQGYPLFVTKRLGDFFGFTKVYEIHLDGLDCTDAEAKEIYDLLKGGVII